MNDTKVQILQTALKMFLKKSYRDVSLTDIVNEMGLTKGAFYHYYKGKQQIFAEAVKYYYSDVLITDYANFPRTSLSDFYQAYIEKLQNSNVGINDNMYEGAANIFLFMSEASRKFSDFTTVHLEQRKKEIFAWTEMVEVAKKNKEFKSPIPAEDIAIMFLNLRDGVTMNGVFSKKSEIKALLDLKRDWDNLYNLLIGKPKWFS
jgi:Transcriptional regulator